MYRGLLLDFYGTLVHEDDEIIPPICEAIRQHASADPDLSARAIAGYWWDVFHPLCTRSHGAGFISQREAALQSLRATLTHYGVSLDPVEIIAPQFAHWTAPPVFPDTHPFLHWAANAGIPMCIVSNIDRCDLEQAIAYHGFYVTHIVTSDDVRAYKPRPEMFAAALAELGLTPDEALHVGDSRSSDIAGAQGVGMAVAWMNRTGKHGTPAPAPTYTVHDLYGVQAILRVDRRTTLVKRG